MASGPTVSERHRRCILQEIGVHNYTRSTHTDDLGSILLKISERKNMLLSNDSHGSGRHPRQLKSVKIIQPTYLN